MSDFEEWRGAVSTEVVAGMQSIAREFPGVSVVPLVSGAGVRIDGLTADNRRDVFEALNAEGFNPGHDGPDARCAALEVRPNGVCPHCGYEWPK